jgi:6-phosphofructokinase 1
MATTIQSDVRFGIVVGGGPAPGINGVISSACLRALDLGYEVVGLYDGMESLCRPEFEVDETVGVSFVPASAKLLGRREMTALHWEGGSLLRTARKRPQDDELPQIAANLAKARIGYLITIGGDDTCQTAHRIAETCAGRVRVVHIPKTIDNDLPLPNNMPTFGFETARAEGTRVLDHLQRDAKATGRWFIVSVMGAKVGHLALGVTKSSRASLAIIPEEFIDEQEQKWLVLDDIVDILIGAMIKRVTDHGRHDGVAVVAEGLIYRLQDLVEKLPKTEHGKPVLADVDFSREVTRRLKERLGKRLNINGGIPLTRGLVPKELGYELRCAPPVPFDVEYTTTLGYAAVRHLAEGGESCLMSLDQGEARPLKLDALMNEQGDTETRKVEIRSVAYEVARSYMIRLERANFDDPQRCAEYAKTCHETPEQFRQRFERMRSLQNRKVFAS